MTRAARSALLALALAAAGWAPAPAAGGVSWYDGSLEEALAEAEGAGRIVLLDCWATWCTYCHEMDREVWSNPDLARGLSRVALPVKAEVDFMSGIGSEIEQAYGIDGLPVVLLIDPRDGSELGRLSGYSDAARVLAASEAAWAAMRGEGAVAESAETAAEQLALASARSLSGAHDEASAAARRALELDPLCSEDVADDAALLLAELFAAEGSAAAEGGAASGVRAEPEGSAAEARDVVAEAAGRCARADRGAELWSRWAALEERVAGSAAAGEVLERKVALFASSGETLLEYAEWAAGAALDGEPLAAALARAERAAEMLPDDPRPLAAAARLRVRAGDESGALELLERAIAIDPHDPDLRELRLRLTLAAMAAGDGS